MTVLMAGSVVSEDLQEREVADVKSDTSTSAASVFGVAYMNVKASPASIPTGSCMQQITYKHTCMQLQGKDLASALEQRMCGVRAMTLRGIMSD